LAGRRRSGKNNSQRREAQHNDTTEIKRLIWDPPPCEAYIQMRVPVVASPRRVRFDLEWTPYVPWRLRGQFDPDEPTFVPAEEAQQSNSSWGDYASKVRIENRLTGQVWYFESVNSLYFLSCLEGQFAFVGKQWVPGIYDIHNLTADALNVVIHGEGYKVNAGGRMMLKAHLHV
jgi:hypothetical protein